MGSVRRADEGKTSAPDLFAALAATFLAPARRVGRTAGRRRSASRLLWRPAPVSGARSEQDGTRPAEAGGGRSGRPRHRAEGRAAVVIELAPAFAPGPRRQSPRLRPGRVVERRHHYRVQDITSPNGAMAIPDRASAGVVRRPPRISSPADLPGSTSGRSAFRQLRADGRPCRRLAGRLRYPEEGPRLADPFLRYVGSA